MNTQELLNEILVILTAYPLFFYTDYCYGDLRYGIGWISISLIACNFLLNVSFMAFVVKDKAKQFLILQKYKQNIKKW